MATKLVHLVIPCALGDSNMWSITREILVIDLCPRDIFLNYFSTACLKERLCSIESHHYHPTIKVIAFQYIFQNCSLVLLISSLILGIRLITRYCIQAWGFIDCTPSCQLFLHSYSFFYSQFKEVIVVASHSWAKRISIMVTTSQYLEYIINILLLILCDGLISERSRNKELIFLDSLFINLF